MQPLLFTATMSHFRAVFLMLVVALLWSTAGVVTRHLDSAESFEVTFWRSAFNAVALAVALTVLRGPDLWRNIFRFPLVIWASGLCWSIMFTAFMVAITLTTVANVLIVMAIGPLMTAFFAFIFLRHRIPPVTWIAISIAGLGIGWMFVQEGSAGLSLAGSFVAFAVPVAAAANFTVLQHIGLGKSVDVIPGGRPVQDMMPAVLIGAILSALVTLPLSLPFRASLHDIGLLSMLGVFQLALPCFLVVLVSCKLSAPEISLLAQLEVVFGVAWAWLWAGESLSTNTLCGGLLVLGALAVNELARLFKYRRSRTTLAIHDHIAD